MTLIRALVSCLFNSRGPSAVFRRVWAIVIFALYCHSCRRVSHVGVEVLEFQPPFANRYSTTTVVAKPSVVWVSTAGEHLTPSMINGLSGHAMHKRNRDNTWNYLTSTRLGIATNKVATSSILLYSTVASNQPHKLFPTVLVLRALKNSKQSVSLAYAYFRASFQLLAKGAH